MFSTGLYCSDQVRQSFIACQSEITGRRGRCLSLLPRRVPRQGPFGPKHNTPSGGVVCATSPNDGMPLLRILSLSPCDAIDRVE